MRQPPFGYVHRRLPIAEAASDPAGLGGGSGPAGSGSGGNAVQFSAALYQAYEADDSLTITVERTGSYNGACSVHYATSDGTATAGLDYTAASGDLTWLDGDGLPKTFEIELLDDALEESPETINLTLSAVVGTVIGARDTAQVELFSEDELATFVFLLDEETVSHATGTKSVALTRTGGTGEASVQVFDAGGGTAVSGTDYQLDFGNVVSWADGDWADKTFEFTVYDTGQPSTKFFNLLLVNPVGGVVGAPSTEKVNILYP